MRPWEMANFTPHELEDVFDMMAADDEAIKKASRNDRKGRKKGRG